MEWGTDKLERESLPSVIVSTVAGYGLYEKWGYKMQEQYFVDLDKIGGEGMYFNAVMTRYPKIGENQDRVNS